MNSLKAIRRLVDKTFLRVASLSTACLAAELLRVPPQSPVLGLHLLQLSVLRSDVVVDGRGQGNCPAAG